MVSFQKLRQQYKQCPIEILKRLVGNGKIEGGDYVALNPRRSDKKTGSFRIDIASGKFHDFATGDRGSSIIDLTAFIYDCDLLTAAQKLQQLFPFLADKSVAADTIPAKKKKLDAVYIWNKSTKAQHQYLDNKRISIGNAKVNIYRGNAQLVMSVIQKTTSLCRSCTMWDIQSREVLRNGENKLRIYAKTTVC